MPDLDPFGSAFNDALVGADDSDTLADAARNMVDAQVSPSEVIRIGTKLGEAFADEIGVESGTNTKSLVATLGYVCGVVTQTLVGDASSEARRDPLTGLENRLAWDEILEHYVDLGRQFSLAIIDLDGLKTINDTQGHEAGDDLLRTFGASLRAAIPEGATAYRFGGDEFSVVLPDLPQQQAEQILADLQQRPGVVAFSLGVTGSTGIGSLDEIKQIADAAMYAQKEERKNAVG